MIGGGGCKEGGEKRQWKEEHEGYGGGEGGTEKK